MGGGVSVRVARQNEYHVPGCDLEAACGRGFVNTAPREDKNQRVGIEFAVVVQSAPRPQDPPREYPSKRAGLVHPINDLVPNGFCAMRWHRSDFYKKLADPSIDANVPDRHIVAA